MNKNLNNKIAIIPKFQKFNNYSISAILLIVGIILTTIGILAIGITVYFNIVINFASEKCHFKGDNIFLNCIFVLICLSLLYLIYKVLPKINKKILLTITLAFSLILGLWWVNYIKFKPVSDQSMIVYCGEKMVENDLPTILNPGEYLNRNPHQLGICVYIMTIFKLFATRSTLTLQILNVIYATISAFILHLICKEIFKEEIVQKICLIFISFFSIYWAFFSVHVYGNLPGLMFALSSLLFTLKFLDNNKISNLVIVAISVTLAYMLKSNYQIFMCAIVICLGLHFLQTYNKQTLAGILLVIITMFGFKSFVYNHVENGTGYSLHEGVPMIAYIYMGIAEPQTLSPGWYTADVEIIYNESNFNKEKSAEIAIENLKNRLLYLIQNPIYTWNFFTSKLQTTWLNPTFQVFWCSTPSTLLDLDPGYNNRIAPEKLLISLICGTAQKIEERVMDVFQIIIFISAGITLILFSKKGDLKKTLLPLTFLGGFLFHIIWETKSIYVIQYFYIMLPFAAYGIYKLFNFIDKKLDTRP